ncbi:MAG: histidine phosphatase family protein [Pyrinomonadaceae bacterium]
MKRLFVLRHAKSSWDHPGLSDFERPLNDRGKKAAPFMGELMLDKEFDPEIVLSSPAKRAKKTAKLVRENGLITGEIVFDERIYGAGTNSLIHILAETGEEFSSAMIVGHNPGFEGLVEVLTGQYERMPTAALAVIELDIEKWSEIASGCGKLAEILRPKEQGHL